MWWFGTGIWRKRTALAAKELKYRLLDPFWAAEAAVDTHFSSDPSTAAVSGCDIHSHVCSLVIPNGTHLHAQVIER